MKKSTIFLILFSTIHTVAVSQDKMSRNGFIDTFVTTDNQQSGVLKPNDTLRIQIQPAVESGLDSGLMVGSLALAVSFVSVIISFLTYKIQQKHNINSLRPLLTVIPSDYRKRAQVELKNQGTGVAIISGWYVRNGLETRSSIIEWLPKKLPNGLSYEDYYIGSEFCALCANETLNFFEIRFDKNNPEHGVTRAEVRNILKDLIVEIHYKDIYEKKYVCKSDLSFFTRVDEESFLASSKDIIPDIQSSQSQ